VWRVEGQEGKMIVSPPTYCSNTSHFLPSSSSCLIIIITTGGSSIT
jgi:hypothetical protein